MNRCSARILTAAIDVHRVLGPGLFETAYLACLEYELRSTGLITNVQVPIPLVYRGVTMACAYRADLVVLKWVIVEIKAVESLAPIHTQQLYTYLRLADYRLGLLLNFGGATMKEGSKRVVNGFPDC